MSEIKSKIFNYGNEKESDWPPQFGTGEKGRFYIRDGEIKKGSPPRRQLANVAHGYIPDEMPPTKHPLDGKHYTSQSKFREVTQAHGYVEVGTAYENGYDPEREDKARESALAEKVVQQFRERLKNGSNRR